MSQQQTSVLPQQQTSVLSEQKTSILSQQQTSWEGTKMISIPFLHLKCSKWNSSGGARRCPGVPGGARGCPAEPDGMVSETLKRNPTNNARWPGLRQLSKLPQMKKGLNHFPGVFWAYFLIFLARDGPFEWVRPIPKAPERSWHASGPSFRPNSRFSTHFWSFLVIWARTDIVDLT